MAEYERLIREAVGGNKTAFEELYKKTNKMVYFTCLSFLKNEQDAQDVSQDVYVTMLEKLNELKDSVVFESWLTRITVNKCKDFIKKKKPLPIDDERLTDLIDSNDNEILIPDEYVNDEAKRKIIMEIIKESLSDVLYQTVVLFYFHDMSAADIAELMDCPVGTITSRLCIARAKIKKGIEEYEEKNNDKLHSVVMIPMLTAILKAEANALKPANVLPGLFSATPDIITASHTAAAESVMIKGGKNMLSTLKGKIIAGVVAAAVVTGGVVAVTTIADNKDKSDENYENKTSITSQTKKKTDKKQDDYKEDANTENGTDEKTDKYSVSYGLSLCDEETVVDIQGSIVDIAMGFDVLCLTKDEKVISLDDEDMAPADVPGGVRFVDNTSGYGAIVERADGTCMNVYDFFETIMIFCVGFEMQDGAYFESTGNMEYIVNNGEKLVGYYYDDDMNLITSEAPVYIDPYSLGEENPVTTAKSWFYRHGGYLLMDMNNNVWKPWEGGGIIGVDYKKDDKCFKITTFNDPVITDCAMLCYSPKALEEVIAKASDDSKLYLMAMCDDTSSEDYGEYFEEAEILLPDGLKTTDIKEFVANTRDGIFITNDNEIYTILERTDGYEVSHMEKLSQLYKDGHIVEIVGDYYDVYVLMDDGCLYEL